MNPEPLLAVLVHRNTCTSTPLRFKEESTESHVQKGHNQNAQRGLLWRHYGDNCAMDGKEGNSLKYSVQLGGSATAKKEVDTKQVPVLGYDDQGVPGPNKSQGTIKVGYDRQN